MRSLCCSNLSLWFGRIGGADPVVALFALGDIVIHVDLPLDPMLATLGGQAPGPADPVFAPSLGLHVGGARLSIVTYLKPECPRVGALALEFECRPEHVSYRYRLGEILAFRVSGIGLEGHEIGLLLLADVHQPPVPATRVAAGGPAGSGRLHEELVALFAGPERVRCVGVQLLEGVDSLAVGLSRQGSPAALLQGHLRFGDGLAFLVQNTTAHDFSAVLFEYVVQNARHRLVAAHLRQGVPRIAGSCPTHIQVMVQRAGVVSIAVTNDRMPAAGLVNANDARTPRGEVGVQHAAALLAGSV